MVFLTVNMKQFVKKAKKHVQVLASPKAIARKYKSFSSFTSEVNKLPPLSINSKKAMSAFSILV